MFKRREKLSWKKRLSGYLWPQGGWKRYGQFILLKLHRLGGTPRSIAARFCLRCGHFVYAVCRFPYDSGRGDGVSAARQHYCQRGRNGCRKSVDFPFIWISVLYTGRLMLGETGAGKIEFAHVFEKCFSCADDTGFQFFRKGRLAGAQADDCRLRAVLCSGLVRVLLSGKEGFGQGFGTPSEKQG